MLSLILVGGLLYATNDGLLGKQAQNTLRFTVINRHTYPSVSEAINSSDYSHFPAIFISLPKVGEYSGELTNPRTGVPLYLDVSYGGGYQCCGAPTFYTYIDKSEKMFWVKQYQAGLLHKTEKWYGPFRFVSDAVYETKRKYVTFDEALRKDDYIKHPATYNAVPIGQNDQYLHPVSKQPLAVTDKTSREASSLKIYASPDSKEFWVQYGTLNVKPEFWSWYGPFVKL